MAALCVPDFRSWSEQAGFSGRHAARLRGSGSAPQVSKSVQAGILTPAHINQLCDLIVRSPVPVIAPKPVAQPKPSAQPKSTPPAAALSTPVAATSATAAPNCPSCGVPMILRTAQRGASVGQQFYGCRNFPKCRQMLPVVSSPAEAAPLPPAEPVSPAPPPPASSTQAGFTYRCGKCQSEVRRIARFCQQCGAAL